MADLRELAATIERLWKGQEELGGAIPRADATEAVRSAIELLDRGEVRVAEVSDGDVMVNEWCKQAILLWFKLAQIETIELGPFEYADKVPLKHDYEKAKVRVVPGASARWGAYLAPGVVMMPSYVNIGAYVGEESMIDTWATVGSCAQIGRRVHLSGGVGIGGVLEPPQATPVVIGDECMIGSRAMITEGARVGTGSLVGAGVVLNPSVPVIDVETGEKLSRGIVPPWCVAISGTRMKRFPGGEFGIGCVLVIKRLTEGERHDKSKLNEVLREHGAAT